VNGVKTGHLRVRPALWVVGPPMGIL